MRPAFLLSINNGTITNTQRAAAITTMTGQMFPRSLMLPPANELSHERLVQSSVRRSCLTCSPHVQDAIDQVRDWPDPRHCAQGIPGDHQLVQHLTGQRVHSLTFAVAQWIPADLVYLGRWA